MTQAESHRDMAERLLASPHDGYPNQATNEVLTALVHAVLALADAKADTK